MNQDKPQSNRQKPKRTEKACKYSEGRDCQYDPLFSTLYNLIYKNMMMKRS